MRISFQVKQFWISLKSHHFSEDIFIFNMILFGLTVSTILTLLIIPDFGSILDDIKGTQKKLLLETIKRVNKE